MSPFRKLRRGPRFLLCLWLAALPLSPVAAQSIHAGLGAIPYAGPAGTGVAFRVWAPGAASLHLSGEFNGWSTPGLALAPDPAGGTWSIDVPAAAVGDRYKFIVNGSLWRSDPRARAYGPTSNNSSVVLADPPAPAPFQRPAAHELVLYELHAGTFHDPDPGDGLVGTFLDATQRLDHLAALGVNAVSVMPCAEFLSARSWGYNPAGLFAIERDYGGRDAFAAFVAACHARGIAVLVDIVHNHWGTPVGDLWQFDATFAATNTGGLYFYEDARAATDWGPRPNFDAPAVRAFILDSLSAYLALGVDGFRWDAVDHMVRIGGSGALIPAAVDLLQEAADLVRAAGGLVIAENAMAEAPAAFDAQWNLAFRSALADALSRADPATRAEPLAAALQAVGTDSVVYVESHDTAGKLNSGALRWPLKVTATNRTLALTGIALAGLARGTPMLFQDQETLHTNLWHDDRPMDWTFADDELQAIAFHRDLIRLRRNLDALSPALLSPDLAAIATNGFVVVARGPDPAAQLLAIANLAATPRQLPLLFPATGAWYRVLSTADTRYGNPGGGTAALFAADEPVPVDVPAFATLLFARQYAPDADMDSDGLPNAWEQLHFDHPTNAAPAADDDNDGASNWLEWLADTAPRDPSNVFHVATAAPAPGAYVLTFSVSSNRLYDIYQTPVPGTPFEPLALDLPGEPPLNTYTDAAPATSRFYQIRAKPLP